MTLGVKRLAPSVASQGIMNLIAQTTLCTTLRNVGLVRNTITSLRIVKKSPSFRPKLPK